MNSIEKLWSSNWFFLLFEAYRIIRNASRRVERLNFLEIEVEQLKVSIEGVRKSEVADKRIEQIQKSILEISEELDVHRELISS
jgi:hypothetical protein